ncbi:hypothetical protein HBI56_190150 [Parastagonospora nodorum]|uniref:Uncharacterized protein n=1 Tax=Phaeosphaeria nodorum (strain SN15 / ATCC MYA-4574 / FGSC 10173) TaxID=321614 RepID=A0A7U2I6A1_PHANO|nr:hypothetical protein HBH56_144310 [Parastagonospora nodorum]QRD01417.1 hypothetical protein JI435_416580 [Parastagonospora nodorum SN15]KAH3927641.1 hypothetical protein HBH54_149500 [Parastagonospora nodorum]KAH3947771.1 hypothetical protein HBH53_109540 [Parastagonospora nodorum]KAH3960099.1 hypothetical protein HBH51_193360 [Parastagonospora nodorum]
MIHFAHAESLLAKFSEATAAQAHSATCLDHAAAITSCTTIIRAINSSYEHVWQVPVSRVRCLGRRSRTPRRAFHAAYHRIAAETVIFRWLCTRALYTGCVHPDSQ